MTIISVHKFSNYMYRRNWRKRFWCCECVIKSYVKKCKYPNMKDLLQCHQQQTVWVNSKLGDKFLTIWNLSEIISVEIYFRQNPSTEPDDFFIFIKMLTYYVHLLPFSIFHLNLIFCMKDYNERKYLKIELLLYFIGNLVFISWG